MQEGDKLTVILLVALIAFAVIIVDEWWLRAAVAFVPSLLLAQRAMQGSDVSEGGEDSAEPDERRSDEVVRGHIEELLKHFREFYTTCHLMASGALEPDVAKDMAGGIERRLNLLLGEVTGAGRADTDG